MSMLTNRPTSATAYNFDDEKALPKLSGACVLEQSDPLYEYLSKRQKSDDPSPD